MVGLGDISKVPEITVLRARVERLDTTCRDRCLARSIPHGVRYLRSDPPS